jgi:hypothetical protein
MNVSINKIRCFLISLIILIYSCVLQAKSEKWYHVEVIVFETKKDKQTVENLPIDPGKPSLSDVINLSTDLNSPVSLLPENKLALYSAKQKIKKNYHLVMHKGWRQQIADSHVQKIHLTGGKQLGADNQYEVDGTVLLSLNRYLQAQSDLLLRKSNQTIRLKDSSRLRLDEIHYIDHPLYGVIIMVTPEKKV